MWSPPPMPTLCSISLAMFSACSSFTLHRLRQDKKNKTLDTYFVTQDEIQLKFKLWSPFAIFSSVEKPRHFLEGLTKHRGTLKSAFSQNLVSGLPHCEILRAGNVPWLLLSNSRRLPGEYSGNECEGAGIIKGRTYVENPDKVSTCASWHCWLIPHHWSQGHIQFKILVGLKLSEILFIAFIQE